MSDKTEIKRVRATYTKKERKMEEEANYFASCLLMPSFLFLPEYEKVAHLHEEERVKRLSKIFEVPEWSVIQRIVQLKNEIL